MCADNVTNDNSHDSVNKVVCVQIVGRCRPNNRKHLAQEKKDHHSCVNGKLKKVQVDLALIVSYHFLCEKVNQIDTDQS